MRNTAVPLVAVMIDLVPLLACGPAPSLPANDAEPADDVEDDSGNPSADHDPPVDEDPLADGDSPPALSFDISTNGCNEARWCGDLFGAQFVYNLELVSCGDPCSIRQTQSDVEGCVLTLSGAVGIAMEGSFPDSYLAFGSVAVGDSALRVVRIENQGDSDCPITSVSVVAGAGSAFSIVDPAIDVLAAHAFIDVAIAFGPTAARGLENALFYVPGAATAWLTLIGVSAGVADATCRLQVDAQHAGGIDVSAYVGGGRTTATTIANAGGGGCLLLPFELIGDAFAAAPGAGPFDDPLAPEAETSFFAYPSTLPLDVTDGVLAPGEHLALDVVFIAPAEEGTTSATLVLRAQDADDVTVPLTGTALQRPPPCTCEENWGSDCMFNPEC